MNNVSPKMLKSPVVWNDEPGDIWTDDTVLITED